MNRCVCACRHDGRRVASLHAFHVHAGMSDQHMLLAMARGSKLMKKKKDCKQQPDKTKKTDRNFWAGMGGNKASNKVCMILRCLPEKDSKATSTIALSILRGVVVSTIVECYGTSRTTRRDSTSVTAPTPSSGATTLRGCICHSGWKARSETPARHPLAWSIMSRLSSAPGPRKR